MMKVILPSIANDSRGDYHRRGLCDMWAALKTVREIIRAGGSLESIDPETIRQLLDGSDPETPLNH
ncbi:hypothetical protein PF001_g33212 [Phytophthora fragariae]|uniref:Uncharacterized protein n=1 Tax=Phytophthora fragariae TaxID=53985 RepID=A0A6A4AM26_9STRA|nr:hypothetical protein PF001_g33212 [Phytophthora fragariae]